MASYAHPAPKSRVSREAVERAVDALLKWIRARSRQRGTAELLPGHGDDLVYLVLTLKKIPHRGRTNAFRIPLPHPLFDQSSSVCLLVDDRPKSPLTPAAARDLVRSLALPVSDVLALSDLRSDYRPFEARRGLADSHDLFLADRRILPLLPGLLGKHFFRKKKIPVPLDLSRQSWPEQLRQCCASTLLYLRSGTCSGIKVGRASQTRDEIVDNVAVAIDAAVGNVPRKWTNVRSFHIKAAESLALPIYQALPEVGFKIEELQQGEEEWEEDERIAKVMKKKDAELKKENKEEGKKDGFLLADGDTAVNELPKKGKKIKMKKFEGKEEKEAKRSKLRHGID